MKYVDEFRNRKLIGKLAQKIKESAPAYPVNIMEVCGTHTQSFLKFGLAQLLPETIQVISGPGCPVCVSAQSYIDSACRLAKDKDISIITFGDMLRMPGTSSNLEKERAQGGDVRVIYSPLDALIIARNNPGKKVVFLAVGFETTAPAIAATILIARSEKIKNIYFFSALKLIPPVMAYLLKDKRLRLSAFLCPGHVSSIIGTRPYVFIADRYKIPCCIAGFEPLDILEGINFLLGQIKIKKAGVINQYARAVRKEGNLKAQKIIRQVFRIDCAHWRGLGTVAGSGLSLRKEFSGFDITKVLPAYFTGKDISQQQSRCLCSEVLKGLRRPDECKLFKKICTPQNPYGPCMVSSEGACHVYYKYR